MIQQGNQTIIGILQGLRNIVAVYSGVTLVWSQESEIQSCFANGYWMDDYPWSDDESWQD